MPKAGANRHTATVVGRPKRPSIVAERWLVGWLSVCGGGVRGGRGDDSSRTPTESSSQVSKKESRRTQKSGRREGSHFAPD